MNISKLVMAVVLASLATLARAQTVEYIHTDGLGSPVAVTNASGAVIERTVYEPYGAVINRPIANGAGYTGHVLDAVTSINYMQQRYYDPQLGRFLSIDPIAADEFGDNFNAYWYANNSPYGFTDPDGLFSTGEWIEDNAQRASDQEKHVETYAWAFLGAAWDAFGAEALSQIYDRNGHVSAGTYATALLEVAPTGRAKAVYKEAEALLGKTAQRLISKRVAAKQAERYLSPGVGAAVRGQFFRGSWIKRSLFRNLQRDAGLADFNKFTAALKKGLVGPKGESGIKILANPVRGFTHELKIGGSGHRLLGRIDEHNVLVFEELIDHL